MRLQIADIIIAYTMCKVNFLSESRIGADLADDADFKGVVGDGLSEPRFSGFLGFAGFCDQAP